MKELRYKNLTKEQKDKICNGCGSKGGWFNPPEFLFHASCNHHDFLYWKGVTEKDRKLADEAFYKYMKKDCKKFYDYIIAYIYYKAVRVMGNKYFNHKIQKTLKDLDDLS